MEDSIGQSSSSFGKNVLSTNELITIHIIDWTMSHGLIGVESTLVALLLVCRTLPPRLPLPLPLRPFFVVVTQHPTSDGSRRELLSLPYASCLCVCIGGGQTHVQKKLLDTHPHTHMIGSFLLDKTNRKSQKIDFTYDA